MTDQLEKREAGAGEAGSGGGPTRRIARWAGLSSTWGQIPLLVVVILAVFYLVPDPGLAISIVVLSLWAASLNLLLGYGGLVSFGHALPFGYGAYATALVLNDVSSNALVALVAAVLASATLAVFVGAVCLRRTAIYFAMLTLAFAQLGYFIALRARGTTGGDDGLAIRETPAALGFEFNAVRDPTTFYLVAAVIALVVFSLLVFYTESPLGRLLQATRESEERARGCGYNTRLVKLITFVLSGAVAGLAGGMFAMSNMFVGLQPYWLLSGEVLIMIILGGRSTLFGSVLGALTFLLLEHYLSQSFGQWQIIVGTIFVACVLIFPQGLWGLVRLERPHGRLRLGRAIHRRATERA
jgi:branched-chain amino acid transport system permease protein